MGTGNEPSDTEESATEEPPHIVIFGSDVMDETNHCDGCGEEFSQEEWSIEEQAGTREHGRILYGCPTEGCDGTARVIFSGERANKL